MSTLKEGIQKILNHNGFQIFACFGWVICVLFFLVLTIGDMQHFGATSDRSFKELMGSIALNIAGALFASFPLIDIILARTGIVKEVRPLIFFSGAMIMPVMLIKLIA